MPFCSFLNLVFAIFVNLASEYFTSSSFSSCKNSYADLLSNVLLMLSFFCPGHITSGEHEMQPILKIRHFFCFRLVKTGRGGATIVIVGGLVGSLIWYFTDNTAATYTKRTVVTDSKKCSDIGDDMLNKGGSAVDAAIAAMFCLGVINMHSSGIGGGGVMLVYNRAKKNASLIDFRETAPFTVSNFTPTNMGVNQSRFGLYKL